MPSAWTGREFQEYCILLLGRRWSVASPHSFQKVPDRHQGDLGLEAFCLEGYAYQCYAAEEPLSAKDCYEKQRDKLTADLNKLRNKQDDVADLLGMTKIHRYVFLVHRHDSRHLISFANQKAQEVMGWGLPFIAPEFSIVIETVADYAIEQERVHAIPRPLIEVVPVAPAETAAWAAQNDDLRLTARDKLLKLTSSTATVETVLDALIDQYLSGENALEKMRTTAPDVYGAALAKKAHQEGLLVLKYPTSTTNTQETLTQIADQVAAELQAENPLIDSSMAQTLAWSSVADWLMRCPLGFGDSA